LIKDTLNPYSKVEQAYIATVIVSMVPIGLITLLFVWFKIFKINPSTSSLLTIMEAFTAGALIGDVFFHSLPHLIADV